MMHRDNFTFITICRNHFPESNTIEGKKVTQEAFVIFPWYSFLFEAG
jgi:hypothetical protein